MVHGQEEYDRAIAASQLLFGKSTSEDLRKLDERTLLDVFDGVPTFEVAKSSLPCGILDFLAVETGIYASKGEARRAIQGNGFSLNKDKFTSPEGNVTPEDVVDGKYILCQKGKKDYYLVIVK